ncbi:hypothetical protein ACFOEZ_04150 [Tianweitania populi]|uniref:Uncharacterized protein n=1 Tax=Tianweitania populi TaxID=1607949 RepID=A0A8J3DMY8_9HYPH|nr:hypothetical protein [Tianweitania populi]GHD07721.1 hypothetical protein GCM10016234_06470 [Tianweitania populi]
MTALFKKIVINIPDAEFAETQIYVASNSVTESQIISGNGDGVICYCNFEQAADMIVSALNAQLAAAETLRTMFGVTDLASLVQATALAGQSPEGSA